MRTCPAATVHAVAPRRPGPVFKRRRHAICTLQGMGGWGVLLLMTVATVVVLISIPAALAIILAVRRRRSDGSASRMQVEARVVDKRSLIARGGASVGQRDFVTFQFPDGNRVELAVPASEAGMLIVGDEGRLEWQGSSYLGFAREIMR